MNDPVRSALGVTGALAAGVLMLHAATGGFRAWTTDAARALAVAADPPPVPMIALAGADGQPTMLADRARVTIVDFIYTDCPSVCLQLAAGFGRMQRTMRERGLEDRVRLLSVSFDPVRDTPARLHEFGMSHAAAAGIWVLAVPADSAALPGLLRTFGVRVIPDRSGGWTHNAALHVVGRDGRLHAILPPDATDEALDVAQRLAAVP
jgi:protein SCO1/2